MMRIEQILVAIEITGEVPLWLAVELSPPGVLRRTWRRANARQRVRWLRARPGALESLAWEVARFVGFSDATVEEARALVHDWKRFCDVAQTQFRGAAPIPPQYYGWFAVGRIFLGLSDMIGSIEETGFDPRRLDAVVLAAGPPTVEETVAYAATILPMGGRR